MVGAADLTENPQRQAAEDASCLWTELVAFVRCLLDAVFIRGM